MKYRILTNDCGPHRYSCFKVIEAASQAEANRKAIKLTQDLPIDPRRKDPTLRVVALPFDYELEDGTDPRGGRIPDDFNGGVIEFR